MKKLAAIILTSAAFGLVIYLNNYAG